jgi:hypothetical protein
MKVDRTREAGHSSSCFPSRDIIVYNKQKGLFCFCFFSFVGTNAIPTQDGIFAELVTKIWLLGMEQAVVVAPVNIDPNLPQPTNPPKPLAKYFAQLRWRDFTNAMRDLLTINVFTKNQSLDIFLIGCDAITTDKEVEGKVLTSNVKMETLQPFVLKKPRYMEKTGSRLVINSLVRIISKILSADEEKRSQQILEQCIFVLLQLVKFLFSENPHQGFLDFQPTFYWISMPIFKFLIGLPSLADVVRLDLCNSVSTLEGIHFNNH